MNLMSERPDISNAVAIEFPLLGEWVTLNTPAKRIPSHGTNFFGQRYAFDFSRADPSEMKFYKGSAWRHIFRCLPADAFLAWEAPVVAAFEGNVVKAGDGWPDRMHINALWETVRSVLLVRGYSSIDYRPLIGNFVMIEGDVGVALYAHLKLGSVQVTEYDRISQGTQIGCVGNSGNSTMPHLHFQLMSSADPMTAKGLLCVFRDMERFVNGEWVPNETVLPAYLERIRPAQ
jgi:hypothetical protein